MSWCLLLLACLPLVSADYKLPTDLVPQHYKLQYVFDVDPATNFSFFAVVDILLKVEKQTSTIVLHAQDFSIAHGNITLQSTGSKAPGVKAHDTHKEYNFLKLHLDAPLLEANNYTLTIPFWGNLKPGLDGVYISSFVNRQTNSKENLVATQFESISARKGFPCFDEPMFKATFQIVIGHHRDYSAVSNMPLATRSGDNSLEPYWPWQHIEKSVKKPKSRFTWDQFETSVPMSTYLVAFVVSKFVDVVSPPGLSTTKFAIWARSDATDQTKYASTVGPKVLSYYEKFFNVSFPLPKQDMFAIPDFSAGAMENWGLITYRETALLYDPEESSIINKERVAEVIAHELAHQWFGNLVTMKWWSDLWLNEGFATFMAAKGMDAVEPQWDATLGYNLDNILRVLVLDALDSSHPVSVPLEDPKRISEIFDEISYRKGSSIIRMMTMFLGEEVFRKAINNYLVKYSYKNAEQDDLWRELTAVAKEHRVLPPQVTVKDIMDTWTKQTGFPILNAVRDYKKGTVSISQSRFFSLKNISSSSSWWIPLSMLGKGQQQQTMQWVSNSQGVKGQLHQIDVKVQADDWLLFNPDMSAPVRINYDADNWLMLAKALPCATGLPVAARVQLLDDAFAFAAADLLDYELTLRITNYLQRETEYLPIETGLQGLSKIEMLLKRHYNYGAFQKYVRRLISDTYHNVGGLATKSIDNENDLNSVKKQVLLSSWACRMQVPGCQENAIELYQTWMDSDTPDEDNPIPRALRATVYCVGVSRGGVAAWRWAVTRRAATNVAAVRDQLLYALACSREPWLLSTLLEWAITEGSEIRQQDASFAIASVVRSPAGYYLARDFVYQRIDDIEKALNGQSRRLGGIVSAILSQFTVQKELDEFMVWFENNKKRLEGSKLVVQQGIEKAKVNIAWMEKHSNHVVEKMREFSK